MKILALDTSTTACSVAICNGNEVAFLHHTAPMQQAKRILPMIQEVLDKLSMSLAQLDAIAYGCGPASFTGIRIANSVAQGLGYAANKPIIPISSLAAIAQSVYMEAQASRCLVAVDARMDQIYWANYEVKTNNHVELSGKESICSPNTIQNPEGADWCGAGDGWVKYKEQIIEHLGFEPRAIYSTQEPTAKAILTLASAKIERGEYTNAFGATPIYLR